MSRLLKHVGAVSGRSMMQPKIYRKQAANVTRHSLEREIQYHLGIAR